MTRYDQEWVDGLRASVEAADVEMAPLRVLYVVTDTADGKAAFHLDLDGGRVATASAGRLPRGQSADLTVTARESVFEELWAGTRSLDAAFMSGDIKVEGAYERWLDELVPLFGSEPWATAWREAVS